MGIAAVTRSGDPATSASTEPMQQKFFLTNVTQRDKVGDKYEATFEYDNGAWVPDANVMWYGSGYNVFHAFTPLNTYENKASYTTFYIPDQSGESFDEKEADWMTASAEARRGDDGGKLSLGFSHMLTKVTVKVPKTGTMDGKDFTVYEYGTKQIKSLFRYCLAEYNGDDVTLSRHPQGHPNDRWVNTKWVDAGTENGKAMTSMSAIIAPGDYSTQFANDSVCRFDIKYDNITEQLATEFSSTTSRTLEAGKHYTYTVTYKETHSPATISQVSVEPWTPETITSPQPADHIPYVTFSAVNEQGFKMMKTEKYSISGLQYCVGDNGTWNDVTVDTPISFGGNSGDLRLRGKNIFGTSDERGNYSYIHFSNDDVLVSCTGDIRTLLDYENYQNVNTKEARFYNLFISCKQLTSAPVLPATELADKCYSGMFQLCSNLTSAPVLPATKLADNCYSGMFIACSALTSAPALPATELAASCYRDMFRSCSSLTSAPELPATELADSCYSGMFEGCTALKSAPELNAKTLADYCYDRMFYKCTALTSAPKLPAETLSEACYSGMFYECTALTSAPKLPAKELAPGCYYEMFSGCKALTSAPTLSAEILANSCYYRMFQSCSSLTSAPELPAEKLTQECYYSMFQGCTKLAKVTMLAKDISAENCLYDWLGYNAGKDASPRTLKLYDAEMYNTIKGKGENWLPTPWQEGSATIEYAPQQTNP